MWTNIYEDLLAEWAALRERASSLPIEDALHLIHDWWNTAPIANPYYHIADCEDWPLPWELLAQDSFCDLAKLIGIAYTILLSDLEYSAMYIAYDNNYHYLIIDNYVLSNETGNIQSDLDKNKITHKINCTVLLARIR